jgi:outer membrane receptor protein involved in Fe transport
MAGALALAGAVLTPAGLMAQAPSTMTITVEDSDGSVLAGATAMDSSGKVLGRSNSDGTLTIDCAAPCPLSIAAPGFSDQQLQLTADTIIHLKLADATEQVTVTAYRTPLAALESPATTRLLSESALSSSAAITMDGKIRQLPGAELYRRTSSLVANPSSQGISLRGLGSTAASRTLLTEDDVPLNDPFAGWIRWQEQPELAIQSVELMRGGASDLYGSSAIGGVVNVIPVRPTADLIELRSSFGEEATYDDSLLMQTKRGPWGLMAAGGAIGTDGYIQEAPSQRGPVDVASNVHSENGELQVEHDRGPLRLLVRGSGFNDARNNGTPDQTNATRLWRYATGGDWQGPHNGALVLRLYGSAEHYRQIFSSIANPTTLRNGETKTQFSLTPENELGVVAHWSQPLGAGLLLVVGADSHNVRVWDQEQKFSSATLTNLRDHQRDSSGYAEVMWVHANWTLTASGRLDWFQNYDGRQLQWNGSSWVPAAAQPTQEDQRVFDPRMGLSRKFANHWAVSASGFRAFRAPSPNELYRTTTVGSQVTSPNFNLLSERATGWETGLATEWNWGSIRTSYFLTQVNRPVVAVTICGTCTPIQLMRENLGQIESRGVSVDFELAPQRWLSLDGGYQYADATVTNGTQDLGNWIPEVAHNMAALNLRAYKPKLGTLNLQGRISGHEFDDDANSFLLHSYFKLDAYASHDFGKRLQLFAAGENLLNRQIEEGKTPTTTLATPRTARAGFQIRLGAESK